MNDTVHMCCCKENMLALVKLVCVAMFRMIASVSENFWL